MNEAIVAANIAKESGAELKRLLKKADGKKHVDRKAFGERVTEFDRAINSFIIKKIQEQFPEDDVITEEAEPIQNGKPERQWFVDPIDGTTNFIRNIPMYCISIGFAQDGAMSAGAIYDPIRDTLFHGSIETNAFQDNAALSVSTRNDLYDALLFEGAGNDPDDRLLHSKIETKLNVAVKSHRNLGTAALMLAYIARGDAEVMIATGIHSWDVAAGVALIRAAGGRVTNYKGEEWMENHNTLVASNSMLHDELLALI
jgi:myo-inositol-1(or 4)-monophosphatase